MLAEMSGESWQLTRRLFLSMTAGGVLGASRRATAQHRPTILLRSSWQTVNIGDIGHTPGVLTLLQRHVPDADVWLWASDVGNGVEALLRERFPRVRITSGSASIEDAFAQCDFLLHSSGPSLVAERDVVRWRQATKKPYGVYGITLPFAVDPGQPAATVTPAIRATLDVLSGASFVFFRDSVSLATARALGCTSPVMDFAPDGAFAVDIEDVPRATGFLRDHALEPGKFLCCIPRFRYTPYWTIPGDPRQKDDARDARNAAMKEHDHIRLREAIVAITRETDHKILICPEDMTQMAIGKEMLLDRLPANVLPRVVWRDRYWLVGEAVSTYVRSAGLFGNEMHSPIMCIGHGVPAIVCRWAEQTTKGYMWRDIGLGDWLFNLDDEGDVPRVAPTVLEMAKNGAAARARADRARQFVLARQRDTMSVVRRTVLDA